MNNPGDRGTSGGATGSSDDTAARAMKEQIERTRSDLGETLTAIEQKLNPATLREKAVEEIQVVEQRVKGAVKEQIEETKAALKVELVDAKENIKREVQEAVVHAKQALRAATIGKVETMARRANETTIEVRDSVLDTLWKNPLPTALLGIGVTWLYLNRRNARSAGNGADYYADSDWRRPSRREGARGDGAGGADQVLRGAAQSAGRAIHDVQQKATDLAHSAGETAKQASQAAGSAAHDAVEGAGRLAHRISNGAGQVVHDAGDMGAHLAEQTRTQVRRVDDSLRDTMHTNPLAIGAAVLAAGAIVGLSLPRTRKEDALMGEARDELLDRARDVAHQAVEGARHLAERGADAARTATESASHRG
jgi:hypothetical protein